MRLRFSLNKKTITIPPIPPPCTFDHQKLKYLQASTLYKQTTKILDDFEEKDDLLNQLINE